MAENDKNKPGKFIRGGTSPQKPPTPPPAKPAAKPPAAKPPVKPASSAPPPQKPPVRPAPASPIRPPAQPTASIKQGKPTPQPVRPAAPPPTSGGLGGGSKNRMRPSNRVEMRKATMASAPMPPPPQQRPFQPVSHQAAPNAANQALLQQANMVQAEFSQLASDAQLSDIYQTIGDLDSKLTELPFAIETLRTRGYVHAGQLEDKLEALENKWDEVRPRVEAALRQHVARLDTELDNAERQVGLLRTPNQANVQSANTAVNSLSRQIEAASGAVAGLFAGLSDQLHDAEQGINRVTTMLDRLQEAHEIQLRQAEGPLLSVDCQWQQNEEEGPNGFLFLTDQRLLFEQREEVATKKLFGLFATEKEKIQKLLLDIDVADIESVTDKEEGGFLGFGKDDILELVCSHKAPVSRAKFHLKGQDSAAWANYIRRVKSGDINKDRAEAYVEELEVAEETAASFPTQCPNCFAEIAAPPRGVPSVTCDFCATVIMPISEG